jgi:hypothetical protein
MASMPSFERYLDYKVKKKEDIDTIFQKINAQIFYTKSVHLLCSEIDLRLNLFYPHKYIFQLQKPSFFLSPTLSFPLPKKQLSLYEFTLSQAEQEPFWLFFIFKRNKISLKDCLSKIRNVFDNKTYPEKKSRYLYSLLKEEAVSYKKRYQHEAFTIEIEQNELELMHLRIQLGLIEPTETQSLFQDSDDSNLDIFAASVKSSPAIFSAYEQSVKIYQSSESDLNNSDYIVVDQATQFELSQDKEAPSQHSYFNFFKKFFN